MREGLSTRRRVIRKTKCLALLVPILALAAGPARFTIGTVDTVGGTTVDWQLNGPSLRMLVNSAGHGIYVVWMYSADTTVYCPDRNMRLNYYDHALQKLSLIHI